MSLGDETRIVISCQALDSDGELGICTGRLEIYPRSNPCMTRRKGTEELNCLTEEPLRRTGVVPPESGCGYGRAPAIR